MLSLICIIVVQVSLLYNKIYNICYNFCMEVLY
nr:MAG TPA: hypothetical protein [Caudoviricetes sp.]